MVEMMISEHPELAGVARRARMTELTLSHTRREIVLKLVVEHGTVSGGVFARLITVPSVDVVCKANNGTLVDASGMPSEAGRGEFDFLEDVSVSGTTLKDSVYPVVANYIGMLDARGRFDKKIYLR